MSDDTRHAIFSTALGPAGVAWTAEGLVGLAFAEGTDEATRARLAALGAPEAGDPPAWAQAAIDGVIALLAGGDPDLRAVPLDLRSVPPFHRRVYDVARAIPRGQTRTYAQVARDAGSPAATRAVGQAMAQNPLPIIVPCHRVLGAGRSLGGFSAPGGVDTKARLLAIEGAASQTSLPFGKTPPTPSA
jgi:methylated-DNA-[protein]-cysteine S-methyltransferase